MPEEAAAEARTRLSEAEAVFGPDHPHTTKVRVELADALNDAGRADEALPLRARIFADVTRDGAENDDTAAAAHSYGVCLHENDRSAEAIAYVERAIRDISPYVPSNGLTLFKLRRDLAVLFRTVDRMPESISLLERILGEDHEDTAVTEAEMQSARLVLADQYRLQPGPVSAQSLAKGEALWQQIIESPEASAGPDDPELSRLRNQFAIYYADTGQQRKALPLYEQALADRERILGADDPDSMITRNNLAICYDDLEERESALELFGPLFERRLRLLGEDDRDTLVTLERLAVCLYHLGRYTEAATHFEILVEARTRLGGPDDRSRTNFLDWAGWSYYGAGRLDEAGEALRRCLADRKRILGPDHPDTMTSRHTLGDFYLCRYMYDHAVLELEHALADRERVLGTGKPDTVRTRALLARALLGDRRHDQSAERRRENVEALEQERGAEDPETIRALLDLGHAENEACRYPAAIAAFTRALEAGEKALGPEHADTVEARLRLAYRFQGAGRFAEAEPLFEQVLENYRRNHGEDEAQTLRIRLEVARCHDGSGLLDQALEEYRALSAHAKRVLEKGHDIRKTLRVNLRRPLPQAWREREPLTGRRLWQVALSAPLSADAVDDGYRLDTLYERRWLDTSRTRDTLRIEEGVRDRERLLTKLERLRNPKSAFDIARYVSLTRRGVVAGFVEEPEAWELLEEVAEQTSETYAGWASFAAHCLSERLETFGLNGFEPESEWPTTQLRKVEANRRLLDEENAHGPFNRVPWEAGRAKTGPEHGELADPRLSSG